MNHRSVHRAVKHVFSQDPALDRGDEAKLAKAFEAYRESGDAAALPTKPGRTVAVFQLMGLSRRAYLELARHAMHEVQKVMAPGAGGMFDMAFYPLREEAARRGLLDATGVFDENGRPFSCDTEDAKGGKRLTDACLDALFEAFGPGLIGELGFRVIELSEMGPT